jgi:hypothetical protein
LLVLFIFIKFTALFYLYLCLIKKFIEMAKKVSITKTALADAYAELDEVIGVEVEEEDEPDFLAMAVVKGKKELHKTLVELELKPEELKEFSKKTRAVFESLFIDEFGELETEEEELEEEEEDEELEEEEEDEELEEEEEDEELEEEEEDEELEEEDEEPDDEDLEEEEEPAPKKKGRAASKSKTKKSKVKEEEPDEEEEEEEEEPAPKKKGRAKSEKSGPKKGKGKSGLGVIATIAKIVEESDGAKGVSKTDILEQLVEEFPDRSESSMKNTVNVQIPNRMSREKFEIVTLENGNFTAKKNVKKAVSKKSKTSKRKK